jgi:hypothetical protein
MDLDAALVGDEAVDAFRIGGRDAEPALVLP